MLKTLREVSFYLLRDFKGSLIFSQALIVIAVVLQVGVMRLNAPLIDDGIIGGDLDALLNVGLTMMLLAVISGILLVVNARFAVFFGQGMGLLLRKEVYDKVQAFSVAEFDRVRTGTLLSRLNADVTNVSSGVMYGLMLLLQAPVMLVAVLIIGFLTSPSLAIVLLIIVVLLAVVLFWTIPILDRAYFDRQDALDEVGNVVQENVAGSRVVKACVRESSERDKFGLAAERMRKHALRAAGLVAVLLPIFQGFTTLGAPLLVGMGGQQILGGESGLSVGEIVAFTQYLAFIVVPLVLMAAVLPLLLRADMSMRRIMAVYDIDITLQDRPDARELDRDSVSGLIEFDDVTFSYLGPDGKPVSKPALSNVSLTIEPGERIGILGSTGSGKSTLVNLLPRLYDPTGGSVRLDGVDIREYSQNSLRQTIGIALQEAVLFRGTVDDNVSFGAPDADQETKDGAALAADSYGFITQLPEAWEAPVARRGYNFSGGQRQRLSMSRSLAPRPRVLVLDDSTSALDVATEARVQAAIPEFAEGVTTIYVAQRISAVIDLDRVVLMDAGRIVDEGNHDDLLERSPLYREIYESQLGPIEEGSSA